MRHSPSMDAPPPYTPIQSDTAASSVVDSASTHSESAVPSGIRGGYVRPDQIPVEPVFASATSYFQERPCTIQPPDFVLRHSLNLMPDTTRSDLPYPQPESRYRARDVTDVDWHTFLNYLLPLSPDGYHQALDQTSSHSPEQQDKFVAIIGEWNELFFGPRGILLHYEPAALPSSSRSVPTQSTLYAALPPYAGSHHEHASNRQQHHDGYRSDVKRPVRSRSSSTSSSSSSSSSSSNDSVASIASRDVDGLNNAQVQQPLDAFRRNAKVNLVAAVAQLRTELRSQPRSALFSSNNKEARAQRQSLQRDIKGEIRNLVRSRRDVKRSMKQERRAIKRQAKQARRQLKRENKAVWKEEKHKYRAAKNEAKHERRTAKKSSKMERRSGAPLPIRVQDPRVSSRGQETGVVNEGTTNTRAPRMMDEKSRG